MTPGMVREKFRSPPPNRLPQRVIATGTPAGVGMGLKPPRWLAHGDVVRIEIDGIGTIENRFVEESA